jgi:hypothetical protein
LPNRNKSSEPIKYLISAAPTDFVIEVPANWKLTFGAVNPGGNGTPGRYGDLHCLRLWEGEKLRAVYCDVKGFRDLSIPLARKIDRETGSSEWTSDSLGNFDGRRTIKVDDGGFQLEASRDPFAETTNGN